MVETKYKVSGGVLGVFIIVITTLMLGTGYSICKEGWAMTDQNKVYYCVSRDIYRACSFEPTTNRCYHIQSSNELQYDFGNYEIKWQLVHDDPNINSDITSARLNTDGILEIEFNADYLNGTKVSDVWRKDNLGQKVPVTIVDNKAKFAVTNSFTEFHIGPDSDIYNLTASNALSNNTVQDTFISADKVFYATTGGLDVINLSTNQNIHNKSGNFKAIFILNNIIYLGNASGVWIFNNDATLSFNRSYTGHLINASVNDISCKTINNADYCGIATNAGVSIINYTGNIVYNFTVAEKANPIIIGKDNSLYWANSTHLYKSNDVSKISLSYNNTGGSGARASVITLTTTGAGYLFSSGYAQGINGLQDDVTWFTGVGVNSTAWIKFDFGAGNNKVIEEVTWYQGSDTAAQGVWIWQGSNDNVAWTNISSTFTLGGALTQIQTVLYGNTNAYRYYQLLGVSGTTSSGPYQREVEFKIGTSNAINSTLLLSNINALESTSTDIYAGNPNGTAKIDIVLFVYNSNNSYFTNASTITSYTHTGGSGNRNTIIINGTSSGGIFNNGAITDLLEGTQDDVAFFISAANVTDKYLLFDFGAGNNKIITEAKWYQSSAATHGTWRWQGSPDNTTWTNIGSTFTLGGTAQLQTQLNGNEAGYRYYRLLGVTGTSSSNPYTREIEFEIIGNSNKILAGSTNNVTSLFLDTDNITLYAGTNDGTSTNGAVSKVNINTNTQIKNWSTGVPANETLISYGINAIYCSNSTIMNVTQFLWRYFCSIGTTSGASLINDNGDTPYLVIKAQETTALTAIESANCSLSLNSEDNYNKGNGLTNSSGQVIINGLINGTSYKVKCTKATYTDGTQSALIARFTSPDSAVVNMTLQVAKFTFYHQQANCSNTNQSYPLQGFCFGIDYTNGTRAETVCTNASGFVLSSNQLLQGWNIVPLNYTGVQYDSLTPPFTLYTFRQPIFVNNTLGTTLTAADVDVYKVTSTQVVIDVTGSINSSGLFTTMMRNNSIAYNFHADNLQGGQGENLYLTIPQCIVPVTIEERSANNIQNCTNTVTNILNELRANATAIRADIASTNTTAGSVNNSAISNCVWGISGTGCTTITRFTHGVSG